MLRWPERHGYGYHSDHLLLDFSIVTVFFFATMRASEQQKSDASKSFQQDALGGIPGLYPPGNPTEATSYPFCGSTLEGRSTLGCLRLYCQFHL